MLKKILSASLIILHILTQSVSAAEFRPVMMPAASPSIQTLPLQVSSDILKNKSLSSGVNDFLFFKISDCFKLGLCRNEALTHDGTDVLLLSVGELTPAPYGAGVNFGAYLRALAQSQISAARQEFEAPRLAGFTGKSGGLGVVDHSLRNNDKSQNKRRSEIYPRATRCVSLVFMRLVLLI